ncbi:MAG: ribose-phosphate pyrophosphokinase [Candidatus Levyibacteriota bacterium]
MKIISGSSSKTLGKKLAGKLSTSPTPLEIYIFPDGEKRVRIIDKVLDQKCVVLQSCCTPVDQNYMELFFIVDALRRSGAKSITAVIPYLGYQRQDHLFRTGEAVSLEVIIKTLEAMGMDKLICFDLHSIKIPELFHMPIIHLSALSLFAKTIKKNKWNNSQSLLISPDMGGLRRIKLLSQMLNDMFFGAIVKSRNLETGQVTADKIEGLENISLKQIKRAFIVDDMISSGGTIITATKLLRKLGIKEVYVFVTHSVFSKSAPKILQKSAVKKFFVTDTVYCPREKRFPKLQILTVADIIAEEIKK